MKYVEIFFALLYLTALVTTMTGHLEPSMVVQAVGMYFAFLCFLTQLAERSKKETK